MSSTPSSSHDGHRPRRDNKSTSSMQSSSSSRSGRSGHPAVESAVTRLLVAIKQLLESLTLWSNLEMTEAQISDVYVRLGNDFNAAVAAFDSFSIDMTDLMSVPEDLRDVLETCLAEDATPENLAIYLPKVRQIITNLLQGLRAKQSMYRRIVSEHQGRHRSSTSHSRPDSRSSRTEKTTSRREEESRHRPNLSRTVIEEERRAERNKETATKSPPRSSSKRPAVQPRMTPPPFEEPEDDLPQEGINERPASTKLNGLSEQLPQSFQPRTSQTPSHSPASSRHSEIQAHAPMESIVISPALVPAALTPGVNKEVPSTPPSQLSAVPSSIKRYSLVDKPVTQQVTPPPTVIIEEPSFGADDVNGCEPSSPQTPPTEAVDVPAVASSLAALKNRDLLERRASKRFSTYQFSRMTGNALTRERTLSGSPSRRSMAASSNLTAGDLAVLTELDEPNSKAVGSPSKKMPRTPSPPRKEFAPPVPPLPHSVDSMRAQALMQTPSNRSKLSEEVDVFESFSPTSFPVFLQVGRHVKRVTLGPGTTFPSLRMLFVDKFTYNPGAEKFPAIYIRDPQSGVQYELEDIEEIKERCLLSLDIEPLDQIKQHIDTQISTLSNDIKDLKSTMSSSRSSSHHFNSIVAHDFAESTPVADRPSDKHFQHAARRLSRIVGDGHSKSISIINPQITGQSLQLQAQTTGASEYSTRVVNDLKTQFDEMQNLRRDLGTMRQLYTEFMKSTKESLGSLRTQTQSVKQIANTKVAGTRTFISVGKPKLDTRSQNALTKVEELEDLIENLKDDVVKRHVTPKPQLLKAIEEDIAFTRTELSSLKEQVDTIKPMWKQTWEQELQNVVEEQDFLAHQEELVVDLQEDHKAVAEVFEHVKKVISLRKTTPNRAARERFKPLPVEESRGGLDHVMMEIRTTAIDPEKRLKAIAASKKNRERELANRSDEFEHELVGFVSGKKLKMTGGLVEVDRLRQKKNDLAIKAMFNASSSSAAESVSSSQLSLQPAKFD